MFLNRTAQCAILIGLYLKRSGKTSVPDMCVNLNLSIGFADQISRKLRLAGIIRTSRGPNGGIELVGDPTVAEILRAVSILYGMPEDDKRVYNQSGVVEHRALALFGDLVQIGMNNILDFPVSAINEGLVTRELQILDDLIETDTVN